MRRIVSRRAGGAKLLDLDVTAAVERDEEAKKWLLRDDGQGGPSLMSFTIMRDALSRLLADALPADGTASITGGKELARVEAGAEGGLTLYFMDGTTSSGFDLVVGCDGIGSEVRRLVLEESGADAQRKSSGIRVRFGVGPAGSRPPGSAGELHQWFSGDGCYALTGTYGGGAEEGGPGAFDMVALTTYEPPPAAAIERGRTEQPSENTRWDSSQIQASVVEALEGAGFSDEVLGVARGADRFFDLGVAFQNPLVPWSKSYADGSCLVLVGDSAHAMPPFLGQGANQAIQDAYTLALELRRPDSPPWPLKVLAGGETNAALRTYEWRRKPATSLLMLESRFLGALETQQGLGGIFRDAFFFFTDKVGVASLVFLKGAVPRVPPREESRDNES
mmetsp:Transcript_48386/g.109926  ORF Transcript_48386/g.109926 Transcript_48386/m.109926 type:complete len:392 (+) Transcript_48386:20-1195(+)